MTEAGWGDLIDTIEAVLGTLLYVVVVGAVVVLLCSPLADGCCGTAGLSMGVTTDI